MMVLPDDVKLMFYEVLQICNDETGELPPTELIHHLIFHSGEKGKIPARIDALHNVGLLERGGEQYFVADWRKMQGLRPSEG